MTKQSKGKMTWAKFLEKYPKPGKWCICGWKDGLDYCWGFACEVDRSGTKKALEKYNFKYCDERCLPYWDGRKSIHDEKTTK